MHRSRDYNDDSAMYAIGAVVLISIAIMVICHLPIDACLVVY